MVLCLLSHGWGSRRIQRVHAERAEATTTDMVQKRAAEHSASFITGTELVVAGTYRSVEKLSIRKLISR